jgi:superfamily I DNA/RNA helicase
MKAALKAQPRSRPKQIENLVETAHSVLSKFNGPLSQRLAAISRLQEKEAEAESVRLMTMHSSKGLEFDLVFMLNCGDQDNGSTLFDPHPERRLFYVGMTRAKNRLVVSYSGKPVRFIAESGIPPHHSIESILA